MKEVKINIPEGYTIDKDLFTVNEFIALTTNEYGGNIIKQLCDTH